MSAEQILKDLSIDSFFDISRSNKIKELINATIDGKTTISHLILWIELEAKIYILTDFSLFEIAITKKNQSVTNVALNSLKKIEIVKYAYDLYKFDRVFINFENHKYDFACNAYSDRVLEFLKLVHKTNISLIKNKLFIGS